MSTRLSSQRRKQVFSALVRRDGARCRECQIAHCIIWRRAGIFATSAPEYYRYTRVNPSSNLEIEHIIPLSKGGTNNVINLQLLCGTCHKRKTAAERRNIGASR
ncbi:HNH endonuclease [Sphingobium yanoikuyae]|uniref:HNH endonuclease n=1 Tax=Sphingobium yanoikuyae TaxID=13690 RepID=UPI003CD068E6